MQQCASDSSRASSRFFKPPAGRPAAALPPHERMHRAADASALTNEQDAHCDGSAGEVTIVAHDIGAVRGMERQISALVTGLLELGHKVTVIGRTCDLPPGAAVTFHRVRGPSRPFVIAYPWFLVAGSLAVRRWRRGIVQATGAIVLNRVDVIAVHYCHRVGSPPPSRAPRVFPAHVRLAGALKRLGERVCFCINRAATFVCVSEGLAEELREYYPALAGRIVTIYNGIETSSFAPGMRHAEAVTLR